MNRSELLLAVAGVLAGTAVVMGLLGVVYNPVLLAVAVPFGVAAYFIWFDATGRLGERLRSRRARRPPGARSSRGRRARSSRRRTQRPPSRSGPGPSTAEARRILGVDQDADESEIRRAYRERAKEAHPDAAEGSEDEFKRLRDAYERLRD